MKSILAKVTLLMLVPLGVVACGSARADPGAASEDRSSERHAALVS